MTTASPALPPDVQKTGARMRLAERIADALERIAWELQEWRGDRDDGDGIRFDEQRYPRPDDAAEKDVVP